MDRLDCTSNRNVRIVVSYVTGILGTLPPLFDGLPYPKNEYPTPQDFFLNEDEWTTHENFEKIFRRAKELVGDPDFYFNCGASAAKLRSWGRFHTFARFFASPADGFNRLPFFGKNFTDAKDIEIIAPPSYDRSLKKFRSLLKVEFRSHFDPNKDYIRDPYLRGIISSIPTIWGLPPANIEQPVNPYNPEILFTKEPELAGYGLDPKIDGDSLIIRDPVDGEERIVGEKVLLQAQLINGKKIYLGKYRKETSKTDLHGDDQKEALLITRTVQAAGKTLLQEGAIYMAPYFILDVTYDRLTLKHRFSRTSQPMPDDEDSRKDLVETIEQMRKSIMAKNRAFQALERTNEELRTAKAQLDEYSRELEKKVDERTEELREAQQELLHLNRNLESTVERQVVELENYKELRRYLSPKLTDVILTSGQRFGAEPQRKMITVVFTDIRSFSSITDSIEPEELFHLLDAYMSEMIRIVHIHDGTLNKIIGDGLLIFFGDPIPMEDHAVRAVRMAIDMQKKIADLKREWLQYGHELGVGIGINTGFMTVGNIGSDIHRDYTVIGNQVNVAARLQSMAKAGQVLISQRTFSKVKDMVSAEPIGEISVKGIHSPVMTYNILW